MSSRWISTSFRGRAPGARAADVEALMAEIRHRVAAQTGVSLHPEVRVLGEAA